MYAGVEILGSVRRPLTDIFDNESAWPDACVQAEGRPIWVHKAVVGAACEPLAALWRPGSQWADGQLELIFQVEKYLKELYRMPDTTEVLLLFLFCGKLGKPTIGNTN